MTGEIERVLFPAEEIERTVVNMGRAITADYAGQDLVLVSVLRGSLFFLADLARAIDLPVTIGVMAITSYGSRDQSGGVVRIIKDLDEDVGGRHVLVVEDIVNSGLTLAYLLKTLRARNPASLAVCTLLDRPEQHLVELPIRYKGFTVKDEYVVGYGLDYKQKLRNLPFIGVLKSI